MDSVQYALALEQYDITVHQPHPPGYFLYVMLGRLLNLFIQDANITFIVISILFSGLTVVAVYYLGKEIFDKKIGIIAAAIAMTSPNLWFHGEVALTNTIEAFFSALVALFCWRIYKGKHKYVWLSVVALAVAGGIRQNTMIFLLPLWLFSVKGVPVRKTVSLLGLLIVCCLLWFIPMVYMTGGWSSYQEAFRELWLFNTGNVSVFEKGLRSGFFHPAWPVLLCMVSGAEFLFSFLQHTP
jgi:4-amino-4-deoxy-L-arabinose transferase-like glycosyltransferase